MSKLKRLPVDEHISTEEYLGKSSKLLSDEELSDHIYYLVEDAIEYGESLHHGKVLSDEEVKAKSESLRRGRMKLLDLINTQKRLYADEAKKNGFYMACGLAGIEVSRVEELWKTCVAKLTEIEVGT